MSLTSSKEIEKNLYELKISVDAKTFGDAVTKVYKKQAKNITIPGFRRGKAPRSIIEKMYGKGVFYEDAINDLIPDAYADALKESGIDAVSRPEFDIESVDDASGVVLVAKVYVKPDVKIENYKGIELKKTVEKVTDDEVKAEIDRVRERNARMIDVEDRAAQNGDTVNIDYEGFVGDKAFEGGKAEGSDLILGSGQFIPGFEDQMIGKNIGEHFDVEVTFPEDYHAKELAGKAATFKCLIHEIKVSELPVLDDEFVKDVSEFDTVDEYKADVKAKLQESADKTEDAKVDEQLMSALCENIEGEIPEAMFENEAENCVRDYENRLRYQGMDLDTFMKYTGQTVDTLKAQFRPQAEKQVKTRLALEYVAKAENLTATEEDIQAEYQKIADAYGIELDKVKESIEEKAIAADVAVGKAALFVRDNAVISDASEAPKKRAPRKKKVSEVEPEAVSESEEKETDAEA